MQPLEFGAQTTFVHHSISPAVPTTHAGKTMCVQCVGVVTEPGGVATSRQVSRVKVSRLVPHSKVVNSSNSTSSGVTKQEAAGLIDV